MMRISECPLLRTRSTVCEINVGTLAHFLNYSAIYKMKHVHVSDMEVNF